ncbi:MAG: ABC transporter permease subunit [Lysobacterales bacterium]
MIAAVARKEFKSIVRDGRFRLLALVCALLIGVAGLNGFQSTLSQARDVAAAAQAETQNFDNQGDKNPHAAAHFGQFAFRPVLLPSAVDPGASAFMGSMVWLEAHRMNLPQARPAEDAVGHGRATRLSVAWALQFIVPLLIMVTAFASIAGERDRGTLALSHSQGVSVAGLVLGKLLGIGVSLAIVLVPPLLVCTVLMAWASPIIESHGNASRLGFMTAVYGLYLTGFAALSLWISLVSKTARQAFLLLLGLWLMFTVLVPRVSADLATQLHPTPSATDFWDGIKRGEGAGTQLPADSRARIGAIRQQTLKRELDKYGVETAEDLPVNFTAVFLQALEEADSPIFDHNFDQLWQTHEAQRGVQVFASILSPTLAIRSVSAALAGTDGFAQRHFSLAAEQHRRKFVAQLNNIQATEGAGARFFVADGERWSTLEKFHYESPSTSMVLGRHGFEILLLIAWALTPLGLALFSATRVGVLP